MHISSVFVPAAGIAGCSTATDSRWAAFRVGMLSRAAVRVDGWESS